MNFDDRGFLRPVPVGDVTRDEEKAISHVCPGRRLEVQAGERENDPLWGPLVGVRIGYALDPEVRYAGSSGGALSAILANLLEVGAVDRVIQTSAAIDPPYGNATVVSGTAEDVLAASGSRYAPSAPLAGLEAALATGQRYAFVGKPCDVAALRRLAEVDPRIDRQIPYMLSFFCAGVPSLNGVREVLRAMGVEPEDTARFRFRGDGWPGYATATRHDGTTARMSYNDSWGKILSRHVQFRCKVCPDGTGMLADIACADAWHCDERGYPTFDEADGLSLIVSRTSKGEDLVLSTIRRRGLSAKRVAVDEIAAMQPGQLRRRRAVLARLAALRLARGRGPDFRGFNMLRAAQSGRMSNHFREFAGTLRRLILRGAGA
ncbi:Coenzyme F420 hydrogenase/dehydrogenase, beta subunit C-terminal domain [Acuticoccus sediminis]|nr:Coenzyme F420 hydrogenase/dehydrogenase, beta subunit C-terminal domain [Acuticoccus sediminis]